MQPLSRKEVYELIDGERDYQDSRWNASTTITEGQHTPGEFLVFMQDYLREAFTQISRQGEPKASQDALGTIRKLAGLAVACMEQNGAPPRPPVE
jgi:hypothetical protein